MVAKRIIPCLDIKNGRTVKGVNFVSLRDAGDPVELAKKYSDAGADELVLLDISATLEERETIYDLVKKVGQEVNIPFAVGGGIDDVNRVEKILKNGADKVSINSAAVRDPQLVNRISNAFGTQCVIVAVDGKKVNGRWLIHTHGGTQPTNIDLFDWVLRVQDLGAGEILFTSMDNDGTKEGFALEALAKIDEILSIPVIASGGAGTVDHFYDAFTKGRASAGLAASIFHFGEIEISDLKNSLINKGINLRP
ncbi:MAG: imidazole glycerol phosphate synthase subunit HisF [Saprospiraceae bacterium]